MSPILGIYASQISGHLYSNSYESIASTTVGAGGSTGITFSSIPSTYQHLQVRVMAKVTSGGSDAWASSLQVLPNSDTTAGNYSRHYLYGESASNTITSSGGADTVPFFGFLPGDGYTNIFGVAVIDILDYANTNKYKTIRSISGSDPNNNGFVGLLSGSWKSTSATSSLLVRAPGLTFAQYTSVALYGIKG